MRWAIGRAALSLAAELAGQLGPKYVVVLAALPSDGCLGEEWATACPTCHRPVHVGHGVPPAPSYKPLFGLVKASLRVTAVGRRRA
jgi:hypothetical protein